MLNKTAWNLVRVFHGHIVAVEHSAQELLVDSSPKPRERNGASRQTSCVQVDDKSRYRRIGFGPILTCRFIRRDQTLGLIPNRF